MAPEFHELPESHLCSGTTVTRRAPYGGSVELLAGLLREADICIGGTRPWDMRLHRAEAADRILLHGSMGLGESYMDGDWDAPQVDELIHRIVRAHLDRAARSPKFVWHVLRAHLTNLQSPRRAKLVGEVHYDLGNDFFEAMLDPYMAYTCGYWADADDLATAQEAKLDLVCRKLGLRPGMCLLDIGCGWGSLMKFAAERYGVRCVGLTISRAQAEYGRERCAGLPVEFRLMDFREIDEPFDRIASLGMFEHVGRHNLRTYFAVARRCLRDDGLFLLHTIGNNFRTAHTDPWIDRYIFPNGDLPALRQVAKAVEHLFVIEDLHNFGADYDRTLMAWHARFEAAWPRFAGRYGERFRRMWSYYLLSCAGAFRARDLQLWQIMLSPDGVPDGYRRPA
ncbi:cyclopropane fatty acyl phospholipid synthase [Aromatoleum petrolei]|uniref:Cyclopropane fatty acyl phospholipid synthase n=1 Tax=Aromatoleum petrolei TaxID=76116 RepID=A0ABX1MJK3_9RHOO|nr:cyclopropane fatty acyl phospholipid synthase [Aromatoleum petrolei]NMF86881.1 cyclopropane fatty acyl phospholipid synthase [Aromatoleum petrolei]QTQ37470.1 Cyclopropane-fatty-acyl-phospholipid synthase [Aromatoleum petrolei]